MAGRNAGAQHRDFLGQKSLANRFAVVPPPVVAGDSYKAPARLATTGDHALSGLLSVDGVAPLAGDRVFAWLQADASTRGIYLAAAGPWARAPDFDNAGADAVAAGATAYVQEGDNNSRTRIVLVTPGAIVIGATALDFIQEGPLLRSDPQEFSIFPGGGPGALVAVETDAAAQMEVAAIRDFRMVSVYVDLTTPGTAGFINVKGRASGKAAPDKDTPADWGAIKADDLTAATGVSVLNDYTIRIAVAGAGRYGPFRFPTDPGNSFSARVWVDDVGTPNVANVFAYRSV